MLWHSFEYCNPMLTVLKCVALTCCSDAEFHRDQETEAAKLIQVCLQFLNFVTTLCFHAWILLQKPFPGTTSNSRFITVYCATFQASKVLAQILISRNFVHGQVKVCRKHGTAMLLQKQFFRTSSSCHIMHSGYLLRLLRPKKPSRGTAGSKRQ